MESERARLLEAAAAAMGAVLRRRFDEHLVECGCGTGDYSDPRYVGGVLHCPVGAEIWYALPKGDQVLIG